MMLKFYEIIPSWTFISGEPNIQLFYQTVNVDYGIGRETQIRWGERPFPSKSGVGFTPTDSTNFSIKTIFPLGRIRVFNYPVNNSASKIELRLNIISDTTTFIIIEFDINETPNLTGDPYLDRDFYYYRRVRDNIFSLNGKNYIIEIIGFGINENNFFNVIEPPENQTSTVYLYARIRDDIIRKLEPEYFRCDFNFEMIMSIITQNDSIKCCGNFRSENDLGKLIWETVDTWSHPVLKIEKNHDFKNVILEFDYLYSGHVNPLDAVYGTGLIVKMLNNTEYHVRLWNYVMGRPEEDWEIGGGELWPNGRIPGSETGSQGHVKLDFNELYAGESKYKWDPQEGWVLSSSWIKINPTQIKSLTFFFTPIEYDNSNNMVPLNDSTDWTVEFSNWEIQGDAFLCYKPNPLDTHPFRLADDYNNNCVVDAKRYVKHFVDLGFERIINLHIGASHYYDKKGVYPLEEEPRGHVPYRYVIKTDVVFNYAFEEWLKNLLYWCREYDLRVILSFSQDMVDPPPEWIQLAHDGEKAKIDREPNPYINAPFCNDECKDYYKRLALKLSDLQHEARLEKIIQIKRSEYWVEENKPCFYDDATKNAFENDKGRSLHEFLSVFDDTTGHEEDIIWLQQKNGEYALSIQDAVREKYPDAKIVVLLSSPAIFDTTAVGEIMTVVNLPTKEWSYPNLNFIQIEDYNWIILQDPLHETIWTFVHNFLSYPSDKIQYFSGFVPVGPNNTLWNKINEAACVALQKGFMDSFIWSGTQIRRDNWYPIYGTICDDDIISIYNFPSENPLLDERRNFDLRVSGEFSTISPSFDGSNSLILSPISNNYLYLKNHNLTNIHPLSSKFSGKAEMTVCFWFKLNNLSESFFLFGKYKCLDIRIDTREKNILLTFGHNSRISKTIPISYESFLEEDQWYHFSLSVANIRYGTTSFGKTFVSHGGPFELIIRDENFEEIFREVNFGAESWQTALDDIYIGGRIFKNKKILNNSLDSTSSLLLEKIIVSKRFLYSNENLKFAKGTYMSRILRERNVFSTDNNVIFHFEFERPEELYDSITKTVKLNKTIYDDDIIQTTKYLTKNGNYSIYLDISAGNLFIPYVNLPNNFPFKNIDEKILYIYAIVRRIKSSSSAIFIVSNCLSEIEKKKSYEVNIFKGNIKVFWGYGNNYSSTNIPIKPLENKWYLFEIGLNSEEKTFIFNVYNEAGNLEEEVLYTFDEELYCIGNLNPVSFGIGHQVPVRKTLLNELILTRAPFSKTDIKKILKGKF